MKHQRAVLLDLDGTLVDSNDQHAQAWVEALAEFGHDVSFEKVRPLIGKGGDKLLPEVTGISAESEQGKRIKERRSRLFLERYAPRLVAFPDVQKLLQRMVLDGTRLVVATSANEEEMSVLVRTAGIEHLLYEATSSSEAKNSKPDPDIVRAALRKAECEAGDAVMLGDTPYDIEAAERASVRCIALRCGGWWSDSDLAGAVAIYDDPTDFLARYDSSPLVA